jgi:hypothetical protein
VDVTRIFYETRLVHAIGGYNALQQAVLVLIPGLSRAKKKPFRRLPNGK